MAQQENRHFEIPLTVSMILMPKLKSTEQSHFVNTEANILNKIL